MVETSLSGSGEGPGWVTGRGYPTAVVPAKPRVFLASDKHHKRLLLSPSQLILAPRGGRVSQFRAG